MAPEGQQRRKVGGQKDREMERLRGIAAEESSTLNENSVRKSAIVSCIKFRFILS
jgi:hypothetical protein